MIEEAGPLIGPAFLCLQVDKLFSSACEVLLQADEHISSACEAMLRVDEELSSACEAMLQAGEHSISTQLFNS